MKKFNHLLIARFIISGVFTFFIVLSLFVLNLYIQYNEVTNDITRSSQSANFFMQEYIKSAKKALLNLADTFFYFKGKKIDKNPIFDGIYYINGSNVIKNLTPSSDEVKFPLNFNISSFDNRFKDSDFYLSNFIYFDGGYKKFLLYRFDKDNFFMGFLDLNRLNSILNGIDITNNSFFLDKDGFFILSSNPSYLRDHLSIYDIYPDKKYDFDKLNLVKNKFGGYDFLYIKKLNNGDFIGASKALFSISKIYTISVFLAFIIFMAVIFIIFYNIKFLKDKILYPVQLLFKMFEVKNNKEQSISDLNEILDDINTLNSNIGIVANNVFELIQSEQNLDDKFLDLNQKWENIFLKSSLIAFIVDLESSLILKSSNEARKFYGYDSFEGRLISDIEGFNFYEQTYENLRSSYLKQSFQIMKHITKQGEVKIMQVQKNLITSVPNPYLMYVAFDVSKFKKLSNNIKEQARYFEYGQDIMLIYDRVKNKIVKISDNEKDIWGYEVSSFLDKRIEFFDLLLPSDKNNLLDIIKNNEEIAKQSKQVIKTFKQIKIKHIDERFYVYRLFMVIDPNSDLILFYFTNIDDIVTDENFFKKDVEKYEKILNTTSLIIWEFDAINNFFTFNNKIFKILGLKNRQTSLKIDFIKFEEDYIFEDDRIKFKDAINNFLNKPKNSFMIEIRLLDSEKNVVFIRLQGGILKKDESGILALSGTIEDISQRKSHELQLKLAASVFSYSHEGIIITDKKAKIISVNKAFEDITGFSQQDVIGKSAKFLYDGDFKKFVSKIYKTLLKKGFYRGEIYSKRKSKSSYPELLTINIVRDQANKITNFVGMFFEISALKEKEEKLIKIANYDDLTGVANKKYFSFLANEEMQRVKQNGGNFAILFIDFDGFKEVNDTYGHDIGDIFLQKITNEMRNVLRNDDILGRLGGDEFGAIIKKIGDKFDIALTLNRLLKAASKKIDVGNNIFINISASIGVSFFKQSDDISFNELLIQADSAMYKAKTGGKNRFYIFDSENSFNQSDLNTSIKNSLLKNEFFLLYQPILNTNSKKIDGFEVYLRWNHPKLGLLRPNEFLFDIKDNDIKISLAKFVFKEVLKELEELKEFNYYISINASVAQICNDEFIDFLQEANKSYLNKIVIELIDIDKSNLELFNKFRDKLKVFSFAYANSINLLNLVEFDYIKLDKNISLNVLSNGKALNTLNEFIEFAKNNHAIIIAQGVENSAIFAFLKLKGVINMQGNFIKKPFEKDELNSYIKNFKYNFNISENLILALHHKELIDNINNSSLTNYEEEFNRLKPFLDKEFLDINMKFYEKAKEIYEIKDDEKLKNFKLDNLKKEILKYIQIL